MLARAAIDAHNRGLTFETAFCAVRVLGAFVFRLISLRGRRIAPLQRTIAIDRCLSRSCRRCLPTTLQASCQCLVGTSRVLIVAPSSIDELLRCDAAICLATTSPSLFDHGVVVVEQLASAPIEGVSFRAIDTLSPTSRLVLQIGMTPKSTTERDKIAPTLSMIVGRAALYGAHPNVETLFADARQYHRNRPLARVSFCLTRRIAARVEAHLFGDHGARLAAAWPRDLDAAVKDAEVRCRSISHFRQQIDAAGAATRWQETKGQEADGSAQVSCWPYRT